MGWIYMLVTGVISGLVASVIFLFYLSLNRPKIKISQSIAKQIDDKGEFYAFKIINKSIRPCINIRVDASIASPTNVEGGVTSWSSGINLQQSHVFEISGYNKDDKQGDYAWRFVTNDNLDFLWKSDEQVIRFRVLATDSYTGFSKAFLQTFRLKRNTIKTGSHQFGLGMDVT